MPTYQKPLNTKTKQMRSKTNLPTTPKIRDHMEIKHPIFFWDELKDDDEDLTVVQIDLINECKEELALHTISLIRESLSKRDFTILMFYFEGTKSQQEIADRLKTVNRSRVSQIIKSSLKKIQQICSADKKIKAIFLKIEEIKNHHDLSKDY